ncbi:MAG: DUF937 domain-containing protein [Ignavibacteria bacterium]|nr:DUF937 domain-containing protein [Ignavibacteria bacterium]
MTDILNGLLGNLTGGDTPEKIGSALNIDPNIIKQAIPVLAPMILGGLKKQSETMGGQERVDHILNKYGDPGVLDNVDSFVEEKSKQESFDANLGGLLGNSGTQVTDVLTKNFNLDGSTAAKLIPMLAPLILGYLTKSRDTSGEGSAGFASFLDQNGDGSIIDDVAGFFTNKQQNNQQSSQGSGGGLMDILGGLLGNK